LGVEQSCGIESDIHDSFSRTSNKASRAPHRWRDVSDLSCLFIELVHRTVVPHFISALFALNKSNTHTDPMDLCAYFTI
ncbi:MAG: hypothetical protein VB071_01985, partial [Lawsonibacter sp.]|nr:hypothetical protein [Lawsonibacter sp.]